MTSEAEKPRFDTKKRMLSYLKDWYRPFDDVELVFHHFRRLDREGKPNHALEFLRAAMLADPMVCLRIWFPFYHFADFHRQWFDTIMTTPDTEKECMILAPRGHAKSSCITSGLNGWVPLHRDEAKFIKLSVFSETKTKAEDFMGAVGKMLTHQVVTELFGDFKSKNWNKQQIDVNTKPDWVRDPSIAAYGSMSSQVTGKHFHMCTADDTISDKIAASPTLLRSYENWHSKTFGPALEVTGFRIYIGTRYSPDEYYQVLLNSGIHWNGVETCSVFTSPDAAKTFMEERSVDCITADDLLWPDVFCDPAQIKDLINTLNRDGEAAFASQYLNQIDLMTGDIYKKEWHRVTTQEFEGECVIAVDLAYSKRETADYTGIAVVRKATTGNIVIERVIEGRYASRDFLQLVYQLYTEFGARMVVMEDEFEAKSIYRNRLILLDFMQNPPYNLRVMTIRQNKDKVVKHRECAIRYETGQVLHRPGCKKLEDQQIAFPKGAHDDVADAAQIGIYYFEEMQSPSHYTQQPGTQRII